MKMKSLTARYKADGYIGKTGRVIDWENTHTQRLLTDTGERSRADEHVHTDVPADRHCTDTYRTHTGVAQGEKTENAMPAGTCEGEGGTTRRRAGNGQVADILADPALCMVC